MVCLTRWTARGESSRNVLKKYTVLQDLWNAVLENTLEPQVKSCIIGIKKSNETTPFLASVMESIPITCHEPSKQHNVFSRGAEGGWANHHHFGKMQNEEHYHLFWEFSRKKASTLQVDEPVLPRTWRAPLQFKTGAGEAYFPLTIEHHYRQSYFEVVDASISCIARRPNQSTCTED